MYRLLGFLLHVMSVTTPYPARPPARCPDATAFTWSPSVPTAGMLFRVRATRGITESAIADALVTVAGEPLHFRRDGGAWVAIAAAPLDSVDGITMLTQCGEARTLQRIALGRGSYRLERLKVAPQFSAPPDSALAERLRREAERAAAISRESHSTPRFWTKSFVAPRSSRITSAFGSGRTFNDSVTSRHMGMDFAGASGAPVRAANRGIVRLVDRFYLGGNVIYIDHGEGLVTAYLHLSKQLVSVGDTVARGAIIGHVGATGRVTAAHLHMIARYGVITVDPSGLFLLR